MCAVCFQRFPKENCLTEAQSIPGCQPKNKYRQDGYAGGTNSFRAFHNKAQALAEKVAIRYA
jgi:hypothetical protein